MSDPEANFPEFDEQKFQEAIANLEESWQSFKQRYNQVTEDEAKKEELQQRKQELKLQQKDNSNREPLKTELHYIEKQLEELEVRLESHLFRWTALSEPFWQAVRFGGMGVVLGWILKSCAG